MNLARKTEQFCGKNSEISQKTESTGGLDPEILQNFGEKKACTRGPLRDSTDPKKIEFGHS